MPESGQRHQVGPERGRLILRTSRHGLAAQMGHDLTIEVTRWSGEVVVGEDQADIRVDVRVDTGSLQVVEGTGGAMPLSDRDKQEIAQTARRLLGVDRHPEARFTSDQVEVTGPDAGVVEGTLTLHGVSRPLSLEVAGSGEGHYRVTGTVVQSDYGIKPYSAFLGALRLADPVGVEAELDLS
jgi:polyisoprenoid-binding protein YceI